MSDHKLLIMQLIKIIFTKTDDKNTRERDPFPVFIFNATRKNVTVEVKSRKSRNKRKGTNSIQTNKILGYFKN